MKKHTSVFMLLVRGRIYKVLLILLSMAAVSLLGFRFAGFVNAPSFCGNRGDWFFGVICLLGYAGCVLSCTVLSSGGAYTFQRLRVSEREILLWDVFVSMLVFLAVYATEIIIIFFAAEMYAAAPGYSQGPQGIVAAFYRTPYLHGMVPMAEKGLWVRNMIYVAAAGISCACMSLNMRYGNRSFSVGIFLLALLMIRFPAAVGRDTYILAFLIACAAVAFFIRTFMRAHNGNRRREDEKTD